MTDQIDLPPVPQTPPVVSLLDYDNSENLILFDRDSHNELVVNLEIRDEDRTETLKARWRIMSKERPPGSPIKEYPCPEPEIPGTGSLMRSHRLTIQSSSLARGKCSRVDYIVSGSFKTCKKDRDDGWDITTQEDDASDIGRLSFWVWDTSDDPFLQPSAALALTTSCPTVDYRPPSATATSATTAEP